MIEASEIARMSPAERVRTMELLWRSMRAANPPSPLWHKKVLAKRLTKVKAGKAEFLSIAQLKRRLARRAP